MGLYAVVVESTGWTGAPGFNTYYFVGSNETVTACSSVKAEAAASLIRDFLTGIATATSDSVSMQIQGDVVCRNLETGVGQNVFRVTETAQSGTIIGDLQSTPTMVVANWRTSTFGPSGRGRTFLPPTSEIHNTAAGQPSGGLLTDVEDAQAALISAASLNIEVEFVVWSRPKFDPNTGALVENGSISVIESGFAKNSWGVLRSRRD